MKLRIIWVGKTRNHELSTLCADYKTRIARFLPLEIVEVKEAKDSPRQIEDEGSKILAAVESSDRVIALDPEGVAWSSQQVATFFKKHMNEDQRRLTFVIGNYSGIADSVRSRSDMLWSLSPLTFTHELARLILMEQIYRALSVLHNLPYSK